MVDWVKFGSQIVDAALELVRVACDLAVREAMRSVYARDDTFNS